MAKNTCCYCETDARELRPYGPNGDYVCFDCAFSSPERTKQTENAFDVLLHAASALSDVIVIGQESGPVPYIEGLQ